MIKFLLPGALFISVLLQAQNPLRFKDEINIMTAGDSAVNKKNIILFTGSSSIRIWKSLKQDFPNHNILNRGFGGSEMSDLVYFADQLIVPYRPKQIFIYEGDNDLGSGKNPDEILKQAGQVLSLIRQKLPKNTKVYFISPKPSILRWPLKDKYESFNQKMKLWCAQNKNVTFIDVWSPMLEKDGTVMKDLFLKDGLHMNQKGYAIWTKVIGEYIR